MENFTTDPLLHHETEFLINNYNKYLTIPIKKLKMVFLGIHTTSIYDSELIKRLSLPTVENKK